MPPLIQLGLDDWMRERRSITLADFPQLAAILAPEAAAGIRVTPNTALNFAAYFNAVDVISSQIGSLPRPVYRRTNQGARERATTHPAWRILESDPNPFMTPVVLWQTLMAHALTWGNAYAEIEFDRALRPIALWPITPDTIEPVTETVVDARGLKRSSVWYRYRGSERIEAEDLIHVPGLGFDGIKGYSVATMARLTLGLGIAAERFGAAFFGNGAWPGVVLQYPNRLSDAAFERTMKAMESRHRGPDQAFRVMVADNGGKVEKIGIPPDDAQFLQTREFQVLEIARWFNLPPHKLKHKVGERPGGNIEASQIEFLTDTLRPWLVRIEQELNRKLFPSSQRSTYYVEHLVDDILRMDGEARARSYQAYFTMGVLDAEQIAEKENLPRPKPKAEPEPAPENPTAPTQDDRDNKRVMLAARVVATDAVRRYLRREAAAVRSHAKRGPEAFAAWADEFYRDEQVVLKEFLLPAVKLGLACVGIDLDPDVIADSLAARHLGRSREELMNLPTKELRQRAEQLVVRWETGRAMELVEAIMDAATVAE